MRDLACWLADAYVIVLLVHLVFSYVPQPPEPLLPIRRFARRLVDPVLTRVRRFLAPVDLGGVRLDLGFLVVFFFVIIVRQIVCGSGL